MLVSGVLVFELVLVAIFAGLLGRSDQELDHSYDSVSVMHHVDKLRLLAQDLELSAGKPEYSRTFDQAATLIPYEVSALRLFLKEDQQSLLVLDEVQELVFGEIERLKEERATGVASPFEYDQYRKFSSQVAVRINRIVRRYQRPTEFVTDQATLGRRITEGNLIFVVLLNAVVAVGTTLYFMQGIVNRISVVADNSVRFGRGEELNPPLEGADEISTLDQILHDTIRERSHVEKLLKESEARTRSLIENMPVGVVTIDETGRIESINPQTEKIFGYSFDELLGDHLISLFSLPEGMDRSEFTEALYREALGRTTRFESRRKNGEIFHIEIQLNEFDSVDGRRFLAIIQDITERQKAEQFKQELIAMVSHDLRSPLTSVQGVITLLSRGMYGQLNETGEKRVKVAEQSLVRLIHLVDDILDLERMEAGKLQFNQEAVSVSSIIDRSIETVYDFAQQRQIRFETFATDLEAFVDEDRMVQVVVNLLSNSIKFSPKNSVVYVKPMDCGDFVEVRVSDSGPGITQEQQEALFQRFHQVEGVQTQYKGTGLGLAICRAILEGQNGSIGVISDSGQGSTFWFRVPKEPLDDGTVIAVSERKHGTLAVQ